MKRNLLITIVLLGGLFISGCGAAHSEMFYSKAYPPTINVEVFTDAPPTLPYDEIGRVWYEGPIQGWMGNDYKIDMRDVLKEAKARGADGLIKVEQGLKPYYDQSGKLNNNFFIKAIMIKYKDTR